ncbi:hypothetical protein [[Clostridium] symbiosum]|uniref:hypothetical protein n=1 Tax=Clostridium symbiosum TaxID=1512 RepID=UPI0034A14552
MGIRVINVMKDGRRLTSLKGIQAPEILYEIVLKEYVDKGMSIKPVESKKGSVKGERTDA